mmetsp:Transcript_19256/g.41740  ORF Transcript_19256/g.41740 Transcript_19256/m.41740 type:complete len:247 (-) Transcript_19256:886-1626(-)
MVRTVRSSVTTGTPRGEGWRIRSRKVVVRCIRLVRRRHSRYGEGRSRWHVRHASAHCRHALMSASHVALMGSSSMICLMVGRSSIAIVIAVMTSSAPAAIVIVAASLRVVPSLLALVGVLALVAVSTDGCALLALGSVRANATSHKTLEGIAIVGLGSAVLVSTVLLVAAVVISAVGRVVIVRGVVKTSATLMALMASSMLLVPLIVMGSRRTLLQTKVTKRARKSRHILMGTTSSATHSNGSHSC